MLPKGQMISKHVHFFLDGKLVLRCGNCYMPVSIDLTEYEASQAQRPAKLYVCVGCGIPVKPIKKMEVPKRILTATEVVIRKVQDLNLRLTREVTNSIGLLRENATAEVSCEPGDKVYPIGSADVSPAFTDQDAGSIKSSEINRNAALTLRYDVGIIEGFKATGKGWQKRMNIALREWLEKHSC